MEEVQTTFVKMASEIGRNTLNYIWWSKASRGSACVLYLRRMESFVHIYCLQLDFRLRRFSYECDILKSSTYLSISQVLYCINQLKISLNISDFKCIIFDLQMYTVMCAVDLSSKISDIQVLILIMSCICHDLDHPGYNNIYQVNARTILAIRYNDISPLENHHCSVAFRILEIPECNILSSLDLTTYRTVRNGIIRCILATDMARHNEILTEFTEIVLNFDYSNINHVDIVSFFPYFTYIIASAFIRIISRTWIHIHSMANVRCEFTSNIIKSFWLSRALYDISLFTTTLDKIISF